MPPSLGQRRRREYHTVRAMIRIYCRGNHADYGADCAACRELEAYATKRLSACVFKEGKPTCQRCPIKCYKPAMRVQMAAVMRYAGPRMLLHHPYWALRHLLDGFKTVPAAPGRKDRPRQ